MRERRPGVWELIVQLPREASDARARQLSRTVHGSKRDAQRALAALVTEVASGKVTSGKVTSSAATLGQLLERWLDHVEDELSPTTVREYRRLVPTRLQPDLGHLTLRRLTTQRLDTLLRVLAATGARRGEVCGLRWSDIDPASGTVSFRRSIATVAGGTIVKDTKTHAARRIALDASTLGALEQLRVEREEIARIAEIEPVADGHVFTSEADGSRPLHPDTVTNGFRRLCTKAGVIGVRPLPRSERSRRVRRHRRAPGSSTA